MRAPIVQKRGFTLVEMMVALVISGTVFFAMGTLLIGLMKIWVGGAGQWYLANQARVARARILSGGLGVGSGVLSLESIQPIQTNPNWCTLEYQVASSGQKYWLRGSVDHPASKKDRSIFMKSNRGGGQRWLMMAGREPRGTRQPEIQSRNFNAAISNRVLSLTYDLRFETGGVVYEQPQLIRAYLVNL